MARSQPVVVVGAGIVGLCCAWLLQRQGHPVALVDPALEGPPSEGSGSVAALGVLMAQVFHRGSGRAWRLRQRSLQLWQDWLGELQARGHPVSRREGLLLLATDPQERERQERLVAERQARGFPLAFWSRERLATLQPAVPAAALGALHSPHDGQLDPRAAMAALLADARDRGLVTHATKAAAISRGPAGQWIVHGGAAERFNAAWLVLSAGVASAGLLEALGHRLPMEPVLGQALELELSAPPGWTWPGVVVWRGQNVVPRPDLAGGRRLWLGATLEPGDRADPSRLAELRGWAGAELSWLQDATVRGQWQGARCHPVGRPAPLLEELEPGLLLASGHYRNGVLLAPASAQWVLEQVEHRAIEH
ncbi:MULTISPECIES: NAD(P)/FAD-dependent oxidoreductase [Aphanothece]|uniref:NAD(P)/FAD-dependent oxidoreductase n=1 Tax=Aphanothece TaxID=1121 RepID=UPI0039855F75